MVGIPVGQRLLVELRSALEQGTADGGDDQDANEGHLKAGGEELAGIEQQQSQSSGAQSVDHGAAAIEKARGEINGANQSGAPDGRAYFREECVGHAKAESAERGRNFAEAQAAQRPEDDERQNAHIHSGDDQNVIRAGALEVCASVAVDESSFADDHGVDEGGLARRPQLVHLGDDAAVDARAPVLHAAAGKARKKFDVLSLRGAQSCDSVGREIFLVVESARIAEVAWRFQAGRESNALAAVQEAHGVGGRCEVFVGVGLGSTGVGARTIDRYANSGVNRELIAGFGCDGFGFHIGGLPQVSEAALSHATVASDVGYDLDFAAVGEGLDAVVELRGGSAQLDV